MNYTDGRDFLQKQFKERQKNFLTEKLRLMTSYTSFFLIFAPISLVIMLPNSDIIMDNHTHMILKRFKITEIQDYYKAKPRSNDDTLLLIDMN